MTPSSSSATSRRPTGDVSAVVFFHPLLVFLAADAQRRFGSRLEALDGDVFAALFAGAEASVVDLGEGFGDLVEERFFAAPQAKGKGLEVFTRSEVHFVGEVIRIERHVLVQRLLRLLDDFVAFLFEKGAE